MPRQVHQIDIPQKDIWSVLFARQDKPFPDTQVIYQDPATGRNYDYARLRRTTEQFGSGLRTHLAWKKGDVLALFSQNCIDTPAVTWGCHWAGGIVSPANPGYTARELGHHLKDSGAKALFTQKALLSTAIKAATEAGISKDQIFLIGDEKDDGFTHFTQLLDETPKGKRAEIDPDEDLSFLVYSSGTTGLPKGVMLTHMNVVSNLFMLNSSEGSILKWDHDKILAVLPYYHIYGLQTLIHFPAYSGITSYVMPAFNLQSFCSIIQDHKITYTYVAPPIVVHLAKNPVISDYDLSSLRMITCGAAPLTKELIYAVKERLNVGAKQAYGLSETSPATHIQKQWDNGVGSNGPALPNQIVKFMSPDGEEVPEGEDGEVWVKGPNVFRGYLNNPDATAACMTSDGFFKTGDIGHEDTDGNMYITDRVKELIKFKGFQVAPAELEGILMGNDLVNDVAVIGIYDEMIASEIPLAFIVPGNGAEKNEESAKGIVGWLDEKVANHKKLRGGVRWIDEIPKSASGKILRRVLKDMLAKEGKFKPKL